MNQAVWKGIVKGKKIILNDQEVRLPDGTEVLVTPLTAAKGSPEAILAAMDAPPHLKPQDVEELRRLIEGGKRPVRFVNPLTHKR